MRAIKLWENIGNCAAERMALSRQESPNSCAAYRRRMGDVETLRMVTDKLMVAFMDEVLT